MSKKTTGLPPAAPGIEPIPDMAQASPGKNRAEGVQVSRALQEHTRGVSEGGGKVTRVEPACGVSGQPALLKARRVLAQLRVQRLVQRLLDAKPVPRGAPNL